MTKSVSLCLDEDDVLAFVAGKLEAGRRGHALVHVDECDTCRSLVAALAQEEADAPEAEPASNSAAPGPPDDRPAVPDDELVDERFHLLSVLGRGAMGTVYRARDQKLGVEVALKLLRTDEATDSKTRAFARELTVGRRVTHPNVCRLHDAGHHGDATYITMELVEGSTLAEILAVGEVSEAHALGLLRGIAAGLAAAHAQGIVHRDLKPANVMVERGTDRAVLTDFGFAADLESKQSRRLVGTPAFWSPEQARGEPASPASDVYSLGLVGYRLLSGREFSLSDTDALRAVPRAYRSFVAACLAARPGDRPADAGKAAELLRPGSRPHRWVAVPVVLALSGAAWWIGHSAPPPRGTEMALVPAPTESPPSAMVLGGPSSSVQPLGEPPASAAPKIEKNAPSAATHVATPHPLIAPPTVSAPKAATGPSSPPKPTEPDPLYRR